MHDSTIPTTSNKPCQIYTEVCESKKTAKWERKSREKNRIKEIAWNL